MSLSSFPTLSPEWGLYAITVEGSEAASLVGDPDTRCMLSSALKASDSMEVERGVLRTVSRSSSSSSSGSPAQVKLVKFRRSKAETPEKVLGSGSESSGVNERRRREGL